MKKLCLLPLLYAACALAPVFSQEPAPASSSSSSSSSSASSAQQSDSQPAIFRTGPVYPANFPDLDVVIEATPKSSSRSDIVLRPADLILTEDGVRTEKPKALKAFSETGQGVAVMLSLDASGSMKGKPLEAVREGLSEFVSRARSYDRVSVQTFADDARLEATWSTPRAEVRQKIESIQTRGQYTRLWDALDSALTELESADLPKRRRLVVISDGHDEGSAKTLAQVIEHAARLRIPVDSIGVTRSDPAYLRYLESLSQSTQGLYRVAPDTDTLKQYVSGGIQRLLESPVATFSASHIRADGEMHRIGVHWVAGDQSDQEQVFIKRKNPAWLPVWVEWWHLALAGAIVLAALVFWMMKRKRKVAMEPPVAPPVYAYQDQQNQNAYGGQPQPLATPRREGTVLEDHFAESGFSKRTSSENLETPPSAQPSGPLPSAPLPSTPSPRRSKTVYGSAFDLPIAGKATAMLRGVQGPGQGKQIAIDGAEFWIGSARNNNFCVDFDPGVSSNHLCIRFEGSSLKIYDNRSTNNTWVNRQPVGETARLLNPGDLIQFGQSVYVLETDTPKA